MNFSYPVTSSKLIFSGPHSAEVGPAAFCCGTSGTTVLTGSSSSSLRISSTPEAVAILSSSGASAAFSIGESIRERRRASVEVDNNKMPNTKTSLKLGHIFSQSVSQSNDENAVHNERKIKSISYNFICWMLLITINVMIL